MAKNKVVDVGAITVAGVTVKRWWRSWEIWNQIANVAISIFVSLLGLAAYAAPYVLEFATQLGLSPFRTMITLIICKVVIEVNVIVQRFRSTAVIGGKTDVQIAKRAADPEYDQ